MNKIKQWYLKIFKKQHTFIYCSCGNELISNNKWCSTKDERVYKYKCNKCNEISYWLFDTPVPIKLKEGKLIQEEIPTPDKPCEITGVNLFEVNSIKYIDNIPKNINIGISKEQYCEYLQLKDEIIKNRYIIDELEKWLEENKYFYSGLQGEDLEEDTTIIEVLNKLQELKGSDKK